MSSTGVRREDHTYDLWQTRRTKLATFVLCVRQVLLDGSETSQMMLLPTSSRSLTTQCGGEAGIETHTIDTHEHTICMLRRGWNPVNALGDSD